MSYARISRGEMAADVLQRDFTQIHNRLFRDPRLSFKAKGIFGLISTHRDGYGVTPEWIAAAGTDGPAAVRTGLRELEKYGYLTRHQERKPDGTLGQMTYSITDMPRSEPVTENRQAAATSDDAQTRRSEPLSDYPHAAEPHAADRAHKKTSAKKTSGEKTNRPSVQADDTATAAGETEKDGGTDGGKLPQQISRNPGVDLLLAIGAEQPEYLLTGKTLHDQGLLVAGMLMDGWTPAQLRHVIAGRPLPGDIRTSVGAIVASRLGQACAAPPPGNVHAPDGFHDFPAARSSGPATPIPTAWSEELVPHALPNECDGQDGLCGKPLPPGAQLCPGCDLDQQELAALQEV